MLFYGYFLFFTNPCKKSAHLKKSWTVGVQNNRLEIFMPWASKVVSKVVVGRQTWGNVFSISLSNLWENLQKWQTKTNRFGQKVWCSLMTLSYENSLKILFLMENNNFVINISEAARYRSTRQNWHEF